MGKGDYMNWKLDRERAEQTRKNKEREKQNTRNLHDLFFGRKINETPPVPRRGR
jgi:hypothetical protein